MYSFGWCSKIEDAESLQRLGFDYIECPLIALSLENGVECAEKIPLYLNSAIPVHAFNLFLPGDLKVVGPDVDQERVRRYLHAAAAVLHKIGAHTAVLGSGKARSVPEGWERSRADDQFVELLSRIANEFVGTGVTLAIEPLNTKESNIVNSVSEAVFFANLLNHSSIRVLADFYHMDEERRSQLSLWVSTDLQAGPDDGSPCGCADATISLLARRTPTNTREINIRVYTLSLPISIISVRLLRYLQLSSRFRNTFPAPIGWFALDPGGMYCRVLVT